MSGLEVLGIVASVISIADLGARLSVKLCTFSRKVKNADRSLAEISNDVALTCSVLRELGDNLKKDEQSRLYSNNAVTTAEGVIKECERVFTDLEGALEREHAGTGTNHISFKKLSGKLKYPFLEPQIELMRSNLERLKSTLLLMLNVIIYAGQLRREEDKKFDVLTKAIEGLKPVHNGVNEPSKTSPLATQSPPAYEAPANVCLNLASQPTDGGGATEPASEELAHYCALVKSLLAEIDAVQYKINQDMRQRFYSKVLGIHSKEVYRLKRRHGPYVVLKAFAHEPALLHALSEIFPHDPLKQRRAMALVEEKNKRPPATDGDNAVAFHSSNRKPVRIATNSRATADNGSPDVGHDSDSETDSVFTNPSITRGPMGGVTNENRDHWSYSPSTEPPYKAAISTSPSLQQRSSYGNDLALTGGVIVEADVSSPQKHVAVGSQKTRFSYVERMRQAQFSATSQTGPIHPTKLEGDITPFADERPAGSKQNDEVTHHETPRPPRASYLKSLSQQRRSELATLRREPLSSTKQDNPNSEDSSHISNTLRSHYSKKGDKFPDWLPPDPQSSAYTASQHLPRQMGHDDQSNRGRDSDSLAAASLGRMMSTPHRGLPPRQAMSTPKAVLSDLWDTSTPTHSSVLSQEGQEAVVRLRARKQRSSESSRVPQGRASLPLADRSKYQFEANSEDDEEAVPVETGNKWLGRNANKGSRVGDTIISGAKTATYEEIFGKAAYTNPSNMPSGQYGRKSAQSYGAYQDRQLTAEEEEEEEEILATKQQIRFMKQQDVSSTRNALRVAAKAEVEETGRNTLARLGAQGERLHNTEKNLDLAADHNRIAEEKARELKTLKRSMFAVHVGNPFIAAERRRELDEDILNSHRGKERLRRAETLILPSTLSSRPPELSPLDIEKIQDSSVTISGSASIQNESSDANQMEMSPTDPKPETTAENVSQDSARGSELEQPAPQVSPLSFNSAPYSRTGVRTPTDIMRQRSERMSRRGQEAREQEIQQRRTEGREEAATEIKSILRQRQPGLVEVVSVEQSTQKTKNRFLQSLRLGRKKEKAPEAIPRKDVWGPEEEGVDQFPDLPPLTPKQTTNVQQRDQRKPSGVSAGNMSLRTHIPAEKSKPTTLASRVDISAVPGSALGRHAVIEKPDGSPEEIELDREDIGRQLEDEQGIKTQRGHALHTWKVYEMPAEPHERQSPEIQGNLHLEEESIHHSCGKPETPKTASDSPKDTEQHMQLAPTESLRCKDRSEFLVRRIRHPSVQEAPGYIPATRLGGVPLRLSANQMSDEEECPEDIDEFHFRDPNKLRREKEKEDSRRRGALAPITKNTTPSAATTEIDDLILQWTNIDKDSLNELNKEAGIGGEEDKLSEIET